MKSLLALLMLIPYLSWSNGHFTNENLKGFGIQCSSFDMQENRVVAFRVDVFNFISNKKVQNSFKNSKGSKINFIYEYNTTLSDIYLSNGNSDEGIIPFNLKIYRDSLKIVLADHTSLVKYDVLQTSDGPQAECHKVNEITPIEELYEQIYEQINEKQNKI